MADQGLLITRHLRTHYRLLTCITTVDPHDVTWDEDDPGSSGLAIGTRWKFEPAVLAMSRAPLMIRRHPLQATCG
jgi:hypothetical protein